MPTVLKNNNLVFSKLASDITSTDTTITVQTGDGSLFANVPARAVIFSSQYPSPESAIEAGSTVEFVEITAVSTDTLTVTRAVEDATRFPASAWSAGDYIAEVLTAGKLNEIENAFVQKTGDTMTGNLIISKTDAMVTLQDPTGKIWRFFHNDTDNNLIFQYYNGSTWTTALRVVNDKFGIGLTPSYQLELAQDSAAKPSTNTWTVTSDERLKENIELADLKKCYEAVKNLPLKRFKWKDDVYTVEQVKDRHKLGWISQDVEKVFPKAVDVHKFEVANVVIEDCKTLNADQIYAAMFGAVQMLIQKVESLENEIRKLKSEV